MSLFRYFLPGLVSLAFITGCAKEIGVETQCVDCRIPLNITGVIDQVHTKATADGFVNNDALGLYAVNYNDNNTVPGTLVAEGNQADNVKYTFDESNYKWNPVKKVYYKDADTNVDLYLYYPYISTIQDVNSYGFEVQKDQSITATSTTLSGYEASDLLWGKAINVSPSETANRVLLSHTLSAVKVTLVEGDGFEEGEFESLAKSVIVMNTTRKALFNLATGSVTSLGSPQQDGIVMCPQEDGSFRAIVIPQVVCSGINLFAITINGVSYFFKQNVNIEYQSGAQTNFTISVKKKTPTGTYELSMIDCQIVDWTEDNNTHGGEARQYYIVNVSEPGSLGSLIRSAKKNPAKIRNLKVSGIINTRDLYYMRDSMAILESINLKEAQIYGIKDGANPIYTLVGDNVSWDYSVETFGEPDMVQNYLSESQKIGYWFADSSKDFGYLSRCAFEAKSSLTYFVFPENLKEIGESAFHGSGLSGSTIIPDDVSSIGYYAFRKTRISSVTLNDKLENIKDYAFNDCSSLSGELYFPESLVRIGGYAFSGCGLSGNLRLPQNLEYIGSCAFANAGSFVGDLTIPEKVTTLYQETFYNCGFTGNLDLNNVTKLNGNVIFANDGFKGCAVLPEGLLEIPSQCFASTSFTSAVLPSTLKSIGTYAFWNSDLQGALDFPEGLVEIGKEAFLRNTNILSLSFPSTLQTIQADAFADCFGVSYIRSDADEPPTIQSGAFDGISKENFSVEVPQQSVIRYKTENGWGDFKRIGAHYDFSLNRKLIRTLNAAISEPLVLRAPSGNAWSVKSKPDWVTIEPQSGIGRTNITVSISEMARTTDTFEVNEGSYNNPDFVSYKGRTGEVVLKLDDKDYTYSLTIEQYDSDYADGTVSLLNESSVGKGIDIVFIGDGYDARDIAKGDFVLDAKNGYNYLFDIEPYNTYKSYFNVYYVVSMSDETGIGTENTSVDSKFGSLLTSSRIKLASCESCFSWVSKAVPTIDLSKSLVIMMMNVHTYDGLTYLYGDGSALACCPVSTEAYPYDYRGIIQHEAGGHGFGKLGDEYIYHNAFIAHCGCSCCDHPHSDDDISTTYGEMKAKGWFKNLSMSSDLSAVPWATLAFNPKYSDIVDVYEGAYMHSRGIYRSELTSCMNNNIPYYSSVSRMAIVERIMECAGTEFNFADFMAKDSFSVGTKSVAGRIDFTFGVDPKFSRGPEEGSVVYMGERPIVK